ncbi:MAG TPA: hypothetical protein VKA19_08955 [Alphaproteobacteria bacterium]|nr:hypothetical protein [Alphaproteobacteria bacterium]
MTKIESPFKGRPATWEHRDKDGRPAAFTIAPRELTPWRAKIADFLAAPTAFGIVAMNISYLEGIGNDSDWVLAAAILLPLLAIPVLRGAWRYLLRKQVRILLTPEQVKVDGWLGWRCYDRTLPHSFALLAHDRTRAEQDAIEFEMRQAQARGQVIRKTRYFGESYHVHLQYLGQRVDLMTVFGQKPARALVERLNACDGIMDRRAGLGDGVTLDPSDEWGDAPGDLP